MQHHSEMETIYIIVGKQVREAKARIAGRFAIIPTPHGPVEFSKWFYRKSEAEKSAKTRYNRKD